jgi:hypothetical protein
VLPGNPNLLEQLNFLRYQAFKDFKLLGKRHAWSIGITYPGYGLFDFVLSLVLYYETHHEL